MSKIDNGGVAPIRLWVLSVCILATLALCFQELRSLNLTNTERTCLMVAGIALGYAGSGRVAAALVFSATKWPMARCMFVGTVLSYLLGTLIAGALGLALAR